MSPAIRRLVERAYSVTPVRPYVRTRTFQRMGTYVIIQSNFDTYVTTL